MYSPFGYMIIITVVFLSQPFQQTYINKREDGTLFQNFWILNSQHSAWSMVSKCLLNVWLCNIVSKSLTLGDNLPHGSYSTLVNKSKKPFNRLNKDSVDCKARQIPPRSDRLPSPLSLGFVVVSKEISHVHLQPHD